MLMIKPIALAATIRSVQSLVVPESNGAYNDVMLIRESTVLNYLTKDFAEYLNAKEREKQMTKPTLKELAEMGRMLDEADIGRFQSPVCELRMKLAADAAKAISHRRDDIIRAAINRVIGEGWTIEGLQGRCCIKEETENLPSVFYLDGEPILEMWDPEFAKHVSEPFHCNWNIKYRFIYVDRKV